jgi:8-amino-3,8-dideoxy-alpha-D-manno-octulosonate transaminase
MPGFEIIGEEERAAVNEVFDNGGALFRYGFDFMRNGSFKVVEFEKEFANHVGMDHGQAVTSGTFALFAINKALGIGAGDEVITQAFTFVATVEAIAETGATPIVTEVDETLNMDPADLERKITDKTKAIWVVHMLGGPARMDEILEIGKRHNIPVLEDTAEAIGAQYGGQPCGALGYASAFSFDFGKTMTTGEGGMALTNSEDFYLKLRAYADHGHEDNPEFPRGEDSATRNGFNLRMMELCGAIGLAQLEKLPGALERVRSNRDKLRAQLSDVSEIVNFRETPEGSVDAGDTLIFYLKTREDREKVTDYLADKGMGFKLLPGAVKWHFAGQWDHIWDYQQHYKGQKYIDLWPKTYDLLQRAIAIPIMIKMDDDQITQIAESIKDGLAQLQTSS